MSSLLEKKNKQTTTSLLVHGTYEKYIRLLLAKILEKHKCSKLQWCHVKMYLNKGSQF